MKVDANPGIKEIPFTIQRPLGSSYVANFLSPHACITVAKSWAVALMVDSLRCPNTLKITIFSKIYAIIMEDIVQGSK